MKFIALIEKEGWFMGYWDKKKYKRQAIHVADRRTVNKRDGLKCYQCEISLELDEKNNGKVKGGQHHHIIPMIYGGKNDATNIVLLCNKCHLLVHSGDENRGKYFLMYDRFLEHKKLIEL